MMLSELTVSVSVPSSGESSAVATTRLARLPAPSRAAVHPARQLDAPPWTEVAALSGGCLEGEAYGEGQGLPCMLLPGLCC